MVLILQVANEMSFFPGSSPWTPGLRSVPQENFIPHLQITQTVIMCKSIVRFLKTMAIVVLSIITSQHIPKSSISICCMKAWIDEWKKWVSKWSILEESESLCKWAYWTVRDPQQKILNGTDFNYQKVGRWEWTLLKAVTETVKIIVVYWI